MLIAVVGLIATLTLMSQSANAYVQASGKIIQLEVIGPGGGAPGNYDFRIHLTGNIVICNGQTWAYLNLTDSNYAAMVANVLAAKASGVSVTLNVTQVGAYCQLSYLVVSLLIGLS